MDDLENTRKKLIYRSWHRGTREMDIIMGRFAEAHVARMDEAALALYQELLLMPDPDVYDWITGQKPVPANVLNPVIESLLNHRHADEAIR